MNESIFIFQSGSICGFLYSTLDVRPEHFGPVLQVFAHCIFHIQFVSGPEISLVRVFNLSVSFSDSWALGVLRTLVFLPSGTTRLSVYLWMSEPGCCLFGQYVVRVHLVDDSFDVLPQSCCLLSRRRWADGRTDKYIGR